MNEKKKKKLAFFRQAVSEFFPFDGFCDYLLYASVSEQSIPDDRA